MWKFVAVFLLSCQILVPVRCEAKVASFPSAKQAKPYEAEQNFRLLKMTMETSSSDALKVLSDDQDLDQDLLEASGDMDEYDYDDEYYEDYDDDEDDEDFGSGDKDLDLILEHEDHLKIIPDDKVSDNDFHFADSNDGKNSKAANAGGKKTTDSDLLYEYYNELYESEDEEDDYLHELEQDLINSADTILEQDNKASKGEPKLEIKPSIFLQPSYIFLMLSSALVSFAVFVLAFFLCRRLKNRKLQQKKKSMVPFVVSTGHRDFHQKSSSPIVKNYQRVPSSTKELIMANQQAQLQQNHQQLEMGLSETQRPLLT
jgi:uncharacterized protein YpmS